MKHKINLYLTFVAVFVSALTMLCTLSISYRVFKQQIQEDLKVSMRLLAQSRIEDILSRPDPEISSKLRITWISSDGTVLYDNETSAGDMVNHMDRPEVKDAFQYGSGESERESDTLNMRTYYEAIRLEDGTVLRVSTEARSLLSVFLQVLPVLLSEILLILVSCIVISHFLTKQLMLPVKELAENMDSPLEQSSYRELQPFIERIRRQHEDILLAARNRQDFTANVSHELKTPLTAISGYAELIENDMADDAMKRKFAGDIRKNADRLVDLINDIIRLSELDQKEVSLDFTPQNLYEIAAERLQMLEAMAARKNVSLCLRGEGEAVSVLSDRSLMVELVDNLIQNAIRYNVPGGNVTVTVEEVQTHATLRVQDTGIGMEKEHLERIFERFYRIDKSRSRETGGTGLGLAIVKHIVELHNGTITVESEIGKGSCFTITF